MDTKDATKWQVTYTTSNWQKNIDESTVEGGTTRIRFLLKLNMGDKTSVLTVSQMEILRKFQMLDINNHHFVRKECTTEQCTLYLLIRSHN
jgi:hypothetical protein